MEEDARAQYIVAGSGGVDAIEEYAPETGRTRLEAWLTSSPGDRRAGISDDDWDLRVGLGVTGGR